MAYRLATERLITSHFPAQALVFYFGEDREFAFICYLKLEPCPKELATDKHKVGDILWVQHWVFTPIIRGYFYMYVHPVGFNQEPKIWSYPDWRRDWK